MGIRRRFWSRMMGCDLGGLLYGTVAQGAKMKTGRANVRAEENGRNWKLVEMVVKVVRGRQTCRHSRGS